MVAWWWLIIAAFGGCFAGIAIMAVAAAGSTWSNEEREAEFDDDNPEFTR